MFGFVNRAYLFQPVYQIAAHLIVYSSLYTAAMMAAMVYISCLLQGLPFDLVATAILMLVVFAVYNLNRKTDEDEDAINHTERYTFTKKYEFILFRSAICAFVVAFCLSTLQGFGSLLITTIPLVAGIVYSVPLFPARFGFRRLKEVPFMKSLIVAFSWTIPATILPICHAGLPPDPATGIVGVFFLLQTFTNTVVYDMRDLEGDAASGVRTIPTILGSRRTLLLLTGMNISIGVALVLAAGLLLDFCAALLLVAGTVYTLGYLLFFQRFGTEKLLFELFTDGEFILLAVVLCLLTLTMPYLAL
ncbi:UbiA family prenyltransferase [Methanoculleus sp.]|uniref:UbiA family prenyltransferase n=1 Tax=Methanoculleus sp. TaxID=90427 RepID=UPI0025F84022|nr:UbiA family prenyltransferase [Methanoculleus sp.]